MIAGMGKAKTYLACNLVTKFASPFCYISLRIRLFEAATLKNTSILIRYYVDKIIAKYNMHCPEQKIMFSKWSDFISTRYRR